MKRLTALLLAAALALSLAACRLEGKAADTVRYGLSNAWDSLMPYNSPSGSNYSRIIYDKIYDRLAYVHADGSLEPRAASSWESADGGTAALFHLDEHAAFHDGTPVTAEHWADTIALLTDPACPTLGRSAFAVLSGTDDTGAAVPGEALGAEAVDKYTLKLTFKTPTTPEDFLLDKNREYYVLPTHLLEETAPEDVMELALWDEPVGSGPCKFVSETPGSQLVLEANPDYQLGAPGFDRLVITVIDKSNLLTSLIAGDLDYYAFGGNVSVEDAEVARAAGLEVLEGTVPNSFYELMLNNETIPSAAVRRAIDLALDKEALCLHTAQGLGEPAASDLTPGTGYDSGLTWARDVDGAKALLTEGGYDGHTHTLACTPGALPLWFTESRFTADNNLFHVADLTPYTQAIAAVKGAAEHDERQVRVEELQALLAGERPFIPLWFGRTLHVQSPTVDGIDYPSSAFSNENVWDWVYRG